MGRGGAGDIVKQRPAGRGDEKALLGKILAHGIFDLRDIIPTLLLGKGKIILKLVTKGHTGLRKSHPRQIDDAQQRLRHGQGKIDRDIEAADRLRDMIKYRIEIRSRIGERVVRSAAYRRDAPGHGINDIIKAVSPLQREITKTFRIQHKTGGNCLFL
ncbi:hypothetical protein SDC9_141894 [bioreactor metagenome]|uniref:Uncharacterized protein n=1 Tax=bioreactor metagenome TaxID=1076179 RepID=A0A645DZI7_9ZZZZ